MARRKNNGGKHSFALGAMVGGLLGGMSALLFAPKSGKKFRKDLCEKCEDASDRAHDLMDDVCEHSSKLLKKAQSAKKSVSRQMKRK